MKKETLHICHLDVVNNMHVYQRCVLNDDALIVVCNKLNNNDSIKLINKFCHIKVYFILEDNFDCCKVIDYRDWVKLVGEYKRTMTWK